MAGKTRKDQNTEDATAEPAATGIEFGVTYMAADAEAGDIAAAAKAVRRLVPVLDDQGRPTDKTMRVALKPDEVFAFRAYEGGRVVVITTDGRRLTSAQAG